MLKKMSILGFVMISIMLLLASIPVAAKGIPVPFAAGNLPVSAWEPGKTDYNLELNVITDQDQIRKELEAIGIDYDKAVDDLQKQISGPGGHWGAMICSGPKYANDLFLTSPGPFIFGFYSGGGGTIAGCFGGDICDGFPACLVNAVCYIPSGQTAVGYTVNAAFTTDLGWGCGP